MSDKIAALKKTIRIWQYIAKHPGISKEETYKNLNLKFDINYCPCCEYIRKKNKPNMEFCTEVCPIWTNEESCLDDKTTYGGWESATNPLEQAKYASDLVRLAQSKLKEEEKSCTQ